MHTRLCFALLLGTLALAASPGWAVTRYVDINSGNDGNSCSAMTSSTTPRQHITNGLSCLNGGDTLIIKSGTYAEAFDNLIPSGSSGSPTILRSETPLGAVLQPVTNTQAGAFFIFQRQFITLDGLMIDLVNANNTSVIVGVLIQGNTTQDIIVQNMEIKNLPPPADAGNGGSGIAVRPEVISSFVHNNHIHHIAYPPGGSPAVNNAHGIYLTATTVFENNHVHHTASHGVHMYNADATTTAHDNIVRNNNIHDTGTRCILIGSGDNNIAYNNVCNHNGFRSDGNSEPIVIGHYGNFNVNTSVYNNTVYGGGGNCIRVGGGDVVTIRNNICYQNSGDVITNTEGATGVVQDHNLLGTNPLFVSNGSDFHLQSGSAAIDAGTCISGITDDFDHNPRPQGSGCDIGAYEFGGGVPPVPGASQGFWKFDDGTGTCATDSSGEGNCLTLNGGLTWQPGRVGPFSLHCDGAGGYASTTAPFTPAAYSWSLWWKGATAPGTTNEHVLMNGLTSESWGLSWGHGSSSFRQGAQHRDTGGSYAAAVVSGTLAANIWYHLAATYDGTNLKMYKNGAIQATTPAGTMMAASGVFTVCGSGTVTPVAGNIDHLKVFDHALTAAEVLREYATTAGKVRHSILQR